MQLASKVYFLFQLTLFVFMVKMQDHEKRTKYSLDANSPLREGITMHRKFVDKEIEAGNLDVLIIETFMSGGIPTFNNMVSWIYDVTKSAIVFIVPDAKEEQPYPRRKFLDTYEALGCVELERGYSAIGGGIIKIIKEAYEKFDNPEDIKNYVRDFFKKVC